MIPDRCNALAVYVCDDDTTRSRTYPFCSDQPIPPRIDLDGAVFSLRAVTYGPLDGVEVTVAMPSRDAIVADLIASDSAVAGEVAA